MMKALFGMTLITMLAAVAAPGAAAYGACVTFCAEATMGNDVTSINDIHTQTCAGNVIVQVGASNNAELCTDDEGNSGLGSS